MSELLLSDMERCASEIENLLAKHLMCGNGKFKRIEDAMKYSALSGGKRIRPYIVVKTCEMLGGDRDVAMEFAAALEMIHTYSLIHDDLPCMDDDDYRRGKLTCHRMYDEATALLAGDGLLTQAFHVIATCQATDKQKVAATTILSTCAGYTGMIGGQMMDLSAENVEIDLNTLISIYSGKTAALLRAAVALGCIASDYFDGKTYDSLAVFAEEIGIAFQIQDDILDVFGSYALGKPLGSDEKNGKTTFLSFMSPEEAKAEVQRRTNAGKNAIAHMTHSSELLTLADYLMERQK